MNQQATLLQVMSKPTPESLWQLRAELLGLGFTADSKVLSNLDAFYEFLNDLVASSTAREYSHFASILDMAAVAGVAFQNLMEARQSEDWWKRFVVGAASEGLMVLAARQYVKAWEEEMKATYQTAAWDLSEEYWELSLYMQPHLSQPERRRLVDELVAPILNQQVNGNVKASLIVRLYQILLLVNIALHSQRSVG